VFRQFHPMILPTIRVHAWGGIGSQIFACIVARRLQFLYPNRKLRLVFHSAGLTSRGIEIPQTFLTDFQHVFIDDFQTPKIPDVRTANKSRGIAGRKWLIRFLERFGFLVRLNEEREFSNLKLWSSEIRGHYTGLNLSKDEIEWAMSMLGIPIHTALHESELSVHLRLGDLLTLPTKTHIPIERIRQVILQFKKMKRFVIFSDSNITEVQRVLGNQSLHPNMNLENLPAIEVIQKCVASEIFIGTNSKISLWISIFRNARNPGGNTFLPVEISNQIRQLLQVTPTVSSTIIY